MASRKSLSFPVKAVLVSKYLLKCLLLIWGTSLALSMVPTSLRIHSGVHALLLTPNPLLPKPRDYHIHTVREEVPLQRHSVDQTIECDVTHK